MKLKDYIEYLNGFLAIQDDCEITFPEADTLVIRYDLKCKFGHYEHISVHQIEGDKIRITSEEQNKL